jgi:phosphate transport system permease protein
MSDIDLTSRPQDTQRLSLDRRPFELRALTSGLLTGLTWGIAILGSIPLFSVIIMLVAEGGARLDIEALTALPPAGFEMGGGFGNAIIGTLVMVAIATAISVPLGLLAAIYLAILDPHSRWPGPLASWRRP